jgi:hypothetical protein
MQVLCPPLRTSEAPQRKGSQAQKRLRRLEGGDEAARNPSFTLSPVHQAKPKPSEKRARRLAKKKELAGTGGVPARGGEAKRARKVAKKKEPTGTPARGGEAQHLSVSGEEGLDFKSEVGVDGEKKQDDPCYHPENRRGGRRRFDSGRYGRDWSWVRRVSETSWNPIE